MAGRAGQGGAGCSRIQQMDHPGRLGGAQGGPAVALGTHYVPEATKVVFVMEWLQGRRTEGAGIGNVMTTTLSRQHRSQDGI